MRIPRPKILSLPFLDDIEEKGVVKASTDLADDVVTRVTAGLNISDVRSVLRGDPPARRTRRSSQQQQNKPRLLKRPRPQRSSPQQKDWRGL